MDVKYVILSAQGEQDPVWFHEIKPPVLCESKAEAEEALKGIWDRNDGSEWDWAVFEVINGKCERRSVVGALGRPKIQSGDRPPYESWALFLRENWRDAEKVAPFLKLPPGVPAEKERVAEYIQDESVLEDKWGNVAEYEEGAGDWFDE